MYDVVVVGNLHVYFVYYQQQQHLKVLCMQSPFDHRTTLESLTVQLADGQLL